MDKSKWEYKKLGDICDKGSSNIAQNKIEDITGEYPLYGASGYVKGINFYHQEKPYIGIVKDGSGVGRANLYPAKSSLLGTMQYIIPKDVCELGFLLYVIKGLHLEKYKTGAAIPHIYFKDYAKSIVPFPSIADQQRIVAELDCLNEMIALKQEQLKEFDKLAQSIFYDMFGDIYSTTFEVKTLNEVCEFIKDGTHQTPTYTEDKENGVKFLSAKDVVSGYISWTNIKHIPYELHEELYKRVSPKRNDLLLCKNGTTGICAIVDTDEIFDIYVSLALLRPNAPCCPFYLLYAINNPYTKKQFDESLKGVGVPNLHLGEIKKARIIYPPLAQQQQFAKKIQAIEAQKELVKQSIAETQQLLDSRMDYYFD